MTPRERLLTAWSFREPDRVPIELRISQRAQEHPRAERLVELIREHTGNFSYCSPYDWGFLGLQATYSERELERRPGDFIRAELTYDTPVGAFTAITRTPDDDMIQSDCHWEKRHITSPDDLERLLDAPFEVRKPDVGVFQRALAAAGAKDVVLVHVLHPLGWLVRHATMEEVYVWFKTHRELMHRFLETLNDHVARVVEVLAQAGIGPHFHVCAHEMLIPPWAGMAFFEEFVFPYDKHVNDVIHRHGGKLQAHCHGNAMNYLERFSEMGIDAIDPLEGPPMGDVDLAAAKRLVGDRMLLSGNIPSPHFVTMTQDEVRQSVRDAIEAAARGGGFSLRTTGADGATRNYEQLVKFIENFEAYMLAGLEYGDYPI